MNQLMIYIKDPLTIHLSYFQVIGGIIAFIDKIKLFPFHNDIRRSLFPARYIGIAILQEEYKPVFHVFQAESKSITPLISTAVMHQLGFN